MIGNSSGDIHYEEGKSDGKEELYDIDEDGENPKDIGYVLTDNVGNGQVPPRMKRRQ